MPPAGDITEILKRWTSDRSGALEELTPIVYNELRRIAASYIRRERGANTLQPTALIHEAYLRLVKQESSSLEDRSHFYGVAARLMRQVLVDTARARLAQKRGGGNHVTLDDGIEMSGSAGTFDYLALHEALDQ